MILSRFPLVTGPGSMMRPFVDSLDIVANAGPISSRSRTRPVLTTMPNAGAADSIVWRCHRPVGLLASRITCACSTYGAISLSSSSHLPPIANSRFAKPVAFAPGFARLATTPVLTGSETPTNTMGTAVLHCSKQRPNAGLLDHLQEKTSVRPHAALAQTALRVHTTANPRRQQSGPRFPAASNSFDHLVGAS